MLADDIAQYLQDNSIGTLTTDLFEANLPDSPDNAIVVIETGGTAPETELPFRSPTFQVYIRNKSYSNGRNKLDAVRDLLHNVRNLTIGSTYFYYIFAIAEGGHVGRDDNSRDLFSINFQAKTRTP